MFFVNKQKKVQAQLEEYNEQVSKCLGLFHQTFEEYCKTSEIEVVQKRLKEVSAAESLADDIRKEVEVMMYSKSLFPESRGDIMGLLETMDRVPNQAEAIVKMTLIQRVLMPEEFHSQFLRLIAVCCRCVDAMLEAAEKLFVDFTIATVAVGKVDELESEADGIEDSLIERIFLSDLEPINKLLLRDLVKETSTICDRAENVGDRIRIMVAKRSI